MSAARADSSLASGFASKKADALDQSAADLSLDPSALLAGRSRTVNMPSAPGEGHISDVQFR